MAKTTVTHIPSHEEISARAYEIYLREGCVAGRDLDNWLKAEAELRASNGNGNGNGNGDPVNLNSAGAGTGKRTVVEAPSSAVMTPVASPAPVVAAASRNATSRRTTAKR